MDLTFDLCTELNGGGAACQSLLSRISHGPKLHESLNDGAGLLRAYSRSPTDISSGMKFLSLFDVQEPDGAFFLFFLTALLADICILFLVSALLFIRCLPPVTTSADSGTTVQPCRHTWKINLFGSTGIYDTYFYFFREVGTVSGCIVTLLSAEATGCGDVCFGLRDTCFCHLSAPSAALLRDFAVFSLTVSVSARFRCWFLYLQSSLVFLSGSEGFI